MIGPEKVRRARLGAGSGKALGETRNLSKRLCSDPAAMPAGPLEVIMNGQPTKLLGLLAWVKVQVYRGFIPELFKLTQAAG